MDKKEYLKEKYGKSLDVDILFNRKIKLKKLSKYFNKELAAVSSISTYDELVNQRKDSNSVFFKNAEIGKQILIKTPSLKFFQQNVELMRSSYGNAWAMAYSIKTHKLVLGAIKEISDTCSGNLEEQLILLYPGKKNCENEDEFDLIRHIQRTNLIHFYLKKNPQLMKICEFIEEVVNGDNKIDQLLKENYFYYDLFGCSYLRKLQLTKGLKSKDPLKWIAPFL